MATTPDQQGAACVDPQLSHVVTNVLRSSQEGELPLSVWTLGLPQAALSVLTRECIPEIWPLVIMPERQYHALQRMVPPELHGLVAILAKHGSPDIRERDVFWLASAMAAASFGSKHFHEDLGLDSQDALSEMILCYFGPLYHKNTAHLDWKKFLFSELDLWLGTTEWLPPSSHLWRSSLWSGSRHKSETGATQFTRHAE